MKRRDARDQCVHYAHLVYAKGWVANHDGNLSVRLSRDRIVATPTSFSKADVTASDLIVVDAEGKKVSGVRRPFSELALHLAIYRARPDALAVLHAHPPYATAMAVAGHGLERPILAEAVVSLGPSIPLLPFKAPKSPGWMEQVEAAAVYEDALMLENHGVITCGVDLEQAFLRMELVEHLATIVHHSMAFGGPQYLDEAALPPLLESRRKAGLGPEARGLGSSPTSSVGAGLKSKIARLVSEEIRNVVK